MSERFRTAYISVACCVAQFIIEHNMRLIQKEHCSAVFLPVETGKSGCMIEAGAGGFQNQYMVISRPRYSMLKNR